MSVQLISINDTLREASGHLEQATQWSLVIPTSSESLCHHEVGTVTCFTEQALRSGKLRGPAVKVLGLLLQPKDLLCGLEPAPCLLWASVTPSPSPERKHLRQGT